MWGIAALRQGKISGRKLVIEVQLLESQVVRVDVAAGLDKLACASDGLPVAQHGLPGLDGFDGDLVPRGDGILRHQVHARGHQSGPRGDGDARHGDVVGGMKLDGGILRRGKTRDVEQHWLL